MHQHNSEQLPFISCLDKSCGLNSTEALRLHYNVKFFSHYADCKAVNPCEIINMNRVSQILRAYSAKIESAKNRTVGRCFQNPFLRASQIKSDSFTSNLSDLQTESNILALSEFPIAQNKRIARKTSNNDPIINGTRFRFSNVGRNDLPTRNELELNRSTNEEKTAIKVEFPSDQRHFSKSCSTDRPFECTICKSAFKRKLHVERHFLVTHTEQKNNVCKICGRSFSRKDYLNKHVVGHVKHNFKLKLLKEGVVVRTKMCIKKQ